MTVKLSRSGLHVNWRADLPFVNNVAVRFHLNTGLEDAAKAFDITGNTHLWLLFAACTLVEREGTVGQQLQQLVKPWQGMLNDSFHNALCQALWDADKRAPYNDPVIDKVPMPTWKSHFYDPDTRTNWLGQYTPTAVSEGSKYYQLALAAFRRRQWRQAGYQLGLALHLLSDLTQPMHAANFTWLDSRDFGFHTDFEKYVKSILPQITPPTRYTPRLDDMNVEACFHAVARYSKDTYLAALCKPEWTQHYRDADRQPQVWQRRVGSLVPVILSDAVQMVGQFLLMWLAEAQGVVLWRQLAEVVSITE